MNDTSENEFININNKTPEKKKHHKKTLLKKSKNQELKDNFVSNDEESLNINSPNKQIDLETSEDDSITLLNFKQSYQYFSHLNLTEHIKNFEEEQNNKRTFYEIICKCFQTKINSDLKKEKLQLICLSKLKYDDKNNYHFNLLQTIFIKLTGLKNCEKSGTHWEKIGFQGKTPGSDLRATGMLSPLQMSYFIFTYPELAKFLYDLLLSKSCEWLFAVTLINITQIILLLLRNDDLDCYCNRSNSVILVINELYVCMVYKLYEMLKDNSEELKAEVISECLEKLRNAANNELDSLYNDIKNIK